MPTAFTIGEAAKRSGVPAKTIRYYESVNLLAAPKRGRNGYRQYAAEDVEVLRFVRRARALGFSIEQVQALLGLWQDQGRTSAEVKTLARAHLEEIETKIRALSSLKATLEGLVERCHGDQGAACPILDDLGGQSS